MAFRAPDDLAKPQLTAFMTWLTSLRRGHQWTVPSIRIWDVLASGDFSVASAGAQRVRGMSPLFNLRDAMAA